MKLKKKKEDILWNCFALFNYKFGMELQLGFLNYFFAVRCVIKYFNSHLGEGDSNFNKFKILKKIQLITKALEFYVETLIITGFLNNNSLNCFLKNNFSKKMQEIVYLEDAINDLKKITNKYKILRLEDLCRIRVKLNIKNFNSTSIAKLKISDESKEFLLFDKEFSRFYIELKNN